MPDALLQVEALEAGYGEVQVLWGVSLNAGSGQLTAIVGANGAGKTTMLRAIAGTIAPWRGRVTFQGKDVTRLPTNVKSARGFALVPEGRQLFSAMTVDENLELGAFSKRAARKYSQRLDQAFGLFPRLAERRRQIAGTLSGGEQQMLALARGLMSDPEILIVDEMSLGLAPVLVYPAVYGAQEAQGSGPDHPSCRTKRASRFGGERLCLCPCRGTNVHRRATCGARSHAGNPAGLSRNVGESEVSRTKYGRSWRGFGAAHRNKGDPLRASRIKVLEPIAAALHQGLRPAAPRRAASTTCRTAVITRSGSVIWMSCPLLVAITCWAPGASAAKASWSSRHTFSCAAT